MIQIDIRKVYKFTDFIEEDFKKAFYDNLVHLIAYEKIVGREDKLGLYRLRYNSSLEIRNLKMLGGESLIKNLENLEDKEFKVFLIFYEKAWRNSLMNIFVSKDEDVFLGAIYYKNDKVVFE